VTDTDNVPDPLAFTYTEAELWASQRIAAARQERGASEGSFWGWLAVLEFGVGFVVLAAYYAGLVQPPEMRAVLFTAYVAFTAGVVAYGCVIYLHYRQLARDSYRQTGQEGKRWELSFDAAGLAMRSETTDTRVAWRAVNAIEQRDGLVLIWFDQLQPVPIPAWTFRDDGERARFITMIAGRIGAARAEKVE
jgi:hypothetical protein